MSLYAVDRVFYDVLENDAQVKAFVGDPDTYLAGRDLDEHEKQALKDCDCGALWSMGAHPLILMRWVRKVQMARGRDGAEAVKEYQRIILPLGRPDYST
jgi:hypothetical protein